MGITNYLRENAIYHKDHKSLIDACVLDLHVARNRAVQAYDDTRRGLHPIILGGETATLPVTNNTGFKGLSESEIRAKHDLKYIFGQAVRKLEKGQFITDIDFIRQCNIKGSGYRQVLDEPDFIQYKGRAGGITYWSHPESIKKMKNESILM